MKIALGELGTNSFAIALQYSYDQNVQINRDIAQTINKGAKWGRTDQSH